MSLAVSITFEGLEEVFQKIRACTEGEGGEKLLEEATKNTVLMAERMLKEITPKGKKGHYRKDGTFVLSQTGIRQGGTARKAWRIGRESDFYTLKNDVKYVPYIRYAWKRVSNVVNDDYMYAGRPLISWIIRSASSFTSPAIEALTYPLSLYYQKEIEKAFGRIWN